MVIIFGHNSNMNVSIAQAKAHLPKLIRAVEDGETVVITRHGKPVASLGHPPRPDVQVVLGGMADTIKLLPGWDDPIDFDEFLTRDL